MPYHLKKPEKKPVAAPSYCRHCDQATTTEYHNRCVKCGRRKPI
jgi:hypothetical protein